jgi:putative integral membrane protein (TIGR02587 family)
LQINNSSRHLQPVQWADWRDEFGDLERALAGGFLFGIPLIYTLEAWDIGASIGIGRIAAFFTLVFLLNLTLVRVSGFKERTTFNNVFFDAVEAMAIGVLGAGVALIALERIDTDTPLNVAMGRLLIESIPFSLGVTLSNLLLRPREAGRVGDPSQGASELSQLLRDVGATIVGAAIVCYAIAPTDEIDILARELGPLQMAVLVVLTLMISFAIVFQTEFGNAEGRYSQVGPFQRPITETVLAYVVSLGVSFLLLVLYNQLDTETDWRTGLDQVIALGFPAAIGGAAGRLAA